jgi:hypothetical protein
MNEKAWNILDVKWIEGVGLRCILSLLAISCIQDIPRLFGYRFGFSDPLGAGGGDGLVGFHADVAFAPAKK